jgi:type III secretory pathway component EscS
MGEIITGAGILSSFTTSYSNDNFLYNPRAITSYTISTSAGLLVFFSLEAIYDALPTIYHTTYQYITGGTILAARLYFSSLFSEELPSHISTSRQVFGHFSGLMMCFTALNFMETQLLNQESIDDSNLGGIIYSGYMYHVIDSIVQGANGIIENFVGGYIYTTAAISTLIDPLLFIGLLKFSPLGDQNAGLAIHSAAAIGFGIQLASTLTSSQNQALPYVTNIQVVVVQQAITLVEYIGATLAAEYIVKPITELVSGYFQSSSLPVGDHLASSDEL